ncbi:alpha/beta hydrolase [Nocardiopsis gilva YIM 90087]|uniref:Alpha/beta hydrolase n=1 Tax=Nocardiopsis gilva YIM 90087 TaxID=1235441 RepID=A0A223S9B0_9ACTN|nr:alpha/beta fold hydrolase [Nocardiopsis gilva]ASU84698.1 alpha/beta hydrolase [Nocardiopsis gilva YIM 90087]
MRRLLTRLCGVAAAAVLVFTTGSPAQAQERAAEPTPVVFVHGFVGKGSQWWAMRRDFLANGYTEDQLHVFTYNWAQSNKTTAEQLRDFVGEVRSSTGGGKVDLVTHSMGGLSSRWFIKFLDGADKVDDWISIAGPNNGTRVAGFCSPLLTSCREMKRDSGFLRELNADNPTPHDVNYVTFRSPCDLIVSPVSSTSLDGANNHRTRCLEHISMMWTPSVITAVRETIA